MKHDVSTLDLDRERRLCHQCGARLYHYGDWDNFETGALGDILYCDNCEIEVDVQHFETAPE